MIFTKRLRQGVREGRITCSVRIWERPHVKAGGVYAMEDGHIVVESIRQIALTDITGELARRSASPAWSICSRWQSTGKDGTSISSSSIISRRNRPERGPRNPPRAFAGRGTGRRPVEGVLAVEGPSPALRAVPLPCKCRGG